ncbi:maltose acetyltransferase [Vagococcus penaei]|uniref:Acetyltransferase n=1 Tax=Vagococcus penaei TaxID=633807 RepID=A0A1Q2D820_9ENTE|nr:sugar O-acetyltransferase [Vagococcus penaei]AQP54497.1 maltose acetyltransferase [Vagococcus penaei]RSU06794.1 maltose acetyltransferase [Vagococcus penaei]
MSEYQRMIQEKLYFARKIEQSKRSATSQDLTQEINRTKYTDPEKISTLLKQLFGKTGESVYVSPPLYVDYGFNTYVGENFYANSDCVFLDVAEIHIGDNVMLGPKVSLLTPGHPIDAGVRTRGLEFGKKIVIGNNVWIGGCTVVNPGVTIGENSIIGSGSVVTKDIPANVIAAGNPARVIREITEADKAYWEAEEQRYYEETEGSN